MIKLSDIKLTIINIDEDARVWLVYDRTCLLCRLDELSSQFEFDQIDIDSYCDGWVKGFTAYINPHSKPLFNKIAEDHKKIREQI